MIVYASELQAGDLLDAEGICEAYDKETPGWTKYMYAKVEYLKSITLLNQDAIEIYCEEDVFVVPADFEVIIDNSTRKLEGQAS